MLNAVLLAQALGYAVKVPFYRWLDLQVAIRAQAT